MDRFIDAYVKALTRYADFATRTSIGDFWRFVAANIVIGIVVGIVDQIIGILLLSLVYSLALLIPGIAAGVRRLHDTGKSGWFLLLWLIPVVGWIIVIVLWVQPSDGPNEWGTAAT